MLSNKITPAKRTKNIEYAVRDIVLVAKEAAKSGKKLLYLNIGDPMQYDFATPEYLRNAVTEAMSKNFNGYSASEGTSQAVEAIKNDASKMGIDNIQDIFVTNGGSEAIDLSFAALLNEGENILIPYPGYPLYSATIIKFGGEINPYYLNEENGWLPDIEDIKSRINSKTKGIVLINPNNPTGAIYPEETLRQIIAFAMENNLVIFSDEIYSKLIFEGKTHISTASLSDEAPIITFNGLSKSYLAPGWRIGWGIVSGNYEKLENYIAAIQKLSRARLCANHPMQFAIKPALEMEPVHLKDTLEKLERRGNLTYEMLNAIDGISCVKPEGAFYAFPKLEINCDDKAFVESLIKETGVVTVHGSGFGQKENSKHLRIVFLPNEEILIDSYEKLAGFIKKYR
ncbi:MAG: aminotransferase class I/II-fold pyridoxal phosphate-dependent enzyme [Pseudomonadota bacterium]